MRLPRLAAVRRQSSVQALRRNGRMSRRARPRFSFPFFPGIPLPAQQEAHMIEGVQRQLTSFSAGFWFFDGKMLKLDRQMQDFFQLASREVPLEDFVSALDAKSADALRKFFSSAHEDALTLTVGTAAADDGGCLLLQGSVLTRDAGEGRHAVPVTALQGRRTSPLRDCSVPMNSASGNGTAYPVSAGSATIIAPCSVCAGR